MRIYLAGPMSSVGPPTWNFPAFREAAARLRALGHEVVMPIEDGDIDERGNLVYARSWYLRRGIRLLADCDALAVLPGWRESEGASFEALVAQKLGVPILRAEDLSPVRETVLDEAARTVDRSRREAYGQLHDNYQATADAARVYIRRRYSVDVPLDARDICWMHILERAIRDANTRSRDNVVDTAGYARNIELLDEDS